MDTETKMIIDPIIDPAAEKEEDTEVEKMWLNHIDNQFSNNLNLYVEFPVYFNGWSKQHVMVSYADHYKLPMITKEKLLKYIKLYFCSSKLKYNIFTRENMIASYFIIVSINQ